MHVSLSSEDASEATRLLAAMDAAYAASDASPRSSEDADAAHAVRDDSVTWRTLWDAWQTALAPYAGRVLLTWVPVPGSRAPAWPSTEAKAGWVMLAVHPRGWTAESRQQWMQHLTQFILSGSPYPAPHWLDGRLPGDRSPGIWAFRVTRDATVSGGWAWAPRTAYPPCGASQSALDVTPLVTATQHALHAALQRPPSGSPVDRWRRAPISHHLRPSTSQALAVGGLAAMILGGVHGLGVLAFAVGGGAALAYQGLRQARWGRWVRDHTE